MWKSEIALAGYSSPFVVRRRLAVVQRWNDVAGLSRRVLSIYMLSRFYGFWFENDDTGHAILFNNAISCLNSTRVSMALRRVSHIPGQVPSDRRRDIREEVSLSNGRLATRYAQKPRERC